MNVKRFGKTLLAIVAVALGLPALMLSLLLIFISGGMLLHNLMLWGLERNFQVVASYHPRESILIEKKTYLGGPSEHGSGTCDFFVGELRSSPLPKEKVRQAYDGGSIKSFNNFGRIPLKILFFDEGRWTMNSPLGDWWDEWYGHFSIATAQTPYFVFASQEGYPYLGDYRCDD